MCIRDSEKTDVPGVYHLGVYVDGTYYPAQDQRAPQGHDHGGGAAMSPAAAGGERFIRILTTMVGMPAKGTAARTPAAPSRGSSPRTRRAPRRR